MTTRSAVALLCLSILGCDDEPEVGGDVEGISELAPVPASEDDSDETEGGGGTFGLNPEKGFNGNVYTIAPAGDGSDDVYAGGSFTSYNGTASSRIIRLNNDGTVDTGFVVGTGFDEYASVYTIAPAGDNSGDVYVGGHWLKAGLRQPLPFKPCMTFSITRLTDGLHQTAFAAEG